MNGRTWRYKIGIRYVKLRPSVGKAVTVSLGTLMGCSEDDFESPSVRLPVTPSDIRAYIEKLGG